jgi:hypothetical protein
MKKKLFKNLHCLLLIMQNLSLAAQCRSCAGWCRFGPVGASAGVGTGNGNGNGEIKEINAKR